MWVKVAIVSGALLFPVLALAKQDTIKDPDGKTIAVILDCNSCKEPQKGKTCDTGVESGYFNGAACGKCLMDSNYGTRIAYGYDLHLVGKIVDTEGQPLGDKFVRLFLPNTWTVRTRTSADGVFHLTLGATVERKGKAVTVQLGDHTMRKDSTAPYYALYMLPETHKPCAPK